MKVLADPTDKETERDQPWQQPFSMKKFLCFCPVASKCSTYAPKVKMLSSVATADCTCLLAAAPVKDINSVRARNVTLQLQDIFYVVC